MLRCENCGKEREFQSLEELDQSDWIQYEDGDTNRLIVLCSEECDREYFGEENED